ncbi:MAG: cation diffusion facilitator family transporter [Chloroflexi bacterium]|nr:cation diffusion facilitator family transporter [Chloroflexota bacterium]
MTKHIHEGHSSISANQRRLWIALAITGLMTIVELVGGVMSNSLALLGDAVHMFTDSLALGLSLVALNLAKRPASQSRTYGFHRAEVLAALANGTILVLVSGLIFYRAYQRFLEPPEVRGGLMLVIAVIGLVANVAGIMVLRSASRENLNVKGAFLHMWSDTISSGGVIAGGLVILVTGWTVVDPIISIFIGLLILRGAVGLVLESSDILLEAVPKHLDVGRISRALGEIEGVRDVHDVHLWTITSGMYALSCHVLIEDQTVSRSSQVVAEVNRRLHEDFGIGHSTLQLECEECENSPVCHIGE